MSEIYYKISLYQNSENPDLELDKLISRAITQFGFTDDKIEITEKSKYHRTLAFLIGYSEHSKLHEDLGNFSEKSPCLLRVSETFDQDYETESFLLYRGKQIDLKTSRDVTALHTPETMMLLCIQENNSTLFNQFLKKVHLADLTILMGYALKYGRHSLAIKLLPSVALPNYTLEDKTLLQLAIERNDIEVAESLIEKGATLSNKGSSVSSLYLAFSESQHKLNFIKLLFKAFPDLDLNAVDQEGKTLLVRAMPWSTHNTLSNYDAIRLLVDSGADINRVDFQGRSLISYARDHEEQEIFLSFGATWGNSDGYYNGDISYGLEWAIKRDEPAIFREIIEERNDDIPKSSDDWIPLVSLAIKYNRFWLIEIAIEKGFDINSAVDGRKILIVAINRRPAWVETLLNSGASLNVGNEHDCPLTTKDPDNLRIYLNYEWIFSTDEGLSKEYLLNKILRNHGFDSPWLTIDAINKLELKQLKLDDIFVAKIAESVLDVLDEKEIVVDDRQECAWRSLQLDFSRWKYILTPRHFDFLNKHLGVLTDRNMDKYVYNLYIQLFREVTSSPPVPADPLNKAYVENLPISVLKKLAQTSGLAQSYIAKNGESAWKEVKKKKDLLGLFYSFEFEPTGVFPDEIVEQNQMQILLKHLVGVDEYFEERGDMFSLVMINWVKPSSPGAFYATELLLDKGIDPYKRHHEYNAVEESIKVAVPEVAYVFKQHGISFPDNALELLKTSQCKGKSMEWFGKKMSRGAILKELIAS